MPSVDALLSQVNAWSSAGWDSYHAIASFCEQRLWNERLKKWEVRSHDNVQLVQCLVADIDTRETHANAGYQDCEQAWYAVQEFCRVVAIPSPLCVGSGGGLHCYWPLAEGLGCTAWTVLATRLKAALEQHGVAADRSRTADASSVLRTPGTIHHKTGRLVEHANLIEPYSLEAFNSLEQYHENRPLRTGTLATPSRRSGNVLGQLHSDDYCNPSLIERSCAQIAHLIRDPTGCAEPMHYAAAGVFSQCGERGREYFLDFERRGYDGHSDGWCLNALDRWTGYNGATCDYFRSINPAGCEGCPHKVSSPIFFARQASGPALQIANGDRSGGLGSDGQRAWQIQENLSQPSSAPPGETPSYQNGHGSAQIFIPQTQDQKIELPKPWCITPDNKLGRGSEDNKGTISYEIVADFPIILDSIVKSEIAAGQHSYVFRQYLPHEGWFPISITGLDMFNGHGIPKLMDGGARIRNNQLFLDYVRDAGFSLDLRKKRAMRFEQFGWKGDTFLLGEWQYCSGPDETDRIVGQAAVAPELATRAQWIGPQPGADAREWARVVREMWRPDHYAAWAMLLASAGAPLMKLLNANEGGVLFSLWDPQSGIGKSHALKMSLSFWGQWKALTSEHYDTPVARSLILAALCNLPLGLDEFDKAYKPDQPDLMRDFIQSFSQGVDRKRGDSSGKTVRHAAGQWQTIGLITANSSILDKLDAHSRGTDAALMRLLELRWDIYDAATARGDVLEMELWEHAGSAGAHYLSHLLRPEVLAYAKTTLREAHAHFVHDLGVSHRFRSHGLACMMMAGLLLQQMGLCPCDPMEVIRWAMAQLHQDKLVRIPPSPHRRAVQALADFLMDNQKNVLRVGFGWVPGQQKIDLAPGLCPVKLLIRHETHTNRLFLDQRTFKKWVITQGWSWTEVCNELHKAGVLLSTDRSKTLGAGTQLASGAAPVVELDASHKLLNTVVDTMQEAVNG